MTRNQPDRLCTWETGTVYTGPRTCGKKARAHAEAPAWNREWELCGIHVRSFRSLHAHTGTVELYADRPDPPRS